MLVLKKFSPAKEAKFRDARAAALAEVNVTTYLVVAAMVACFSWWDYFVDPVNWYTAFKIRCVGVVGILATGMVQRWSGRIDWAPAIAKVRYTIAVTTVAGALSVLQQGFTVGIASLVVVLLAGPYIARDRRDLLLLNIVPMLSIVTIIYFAEPDVFAVINSMIFIALALTTSVSLSEVFESANRRVFEIEEALTNEARTDSLTGLRNRRALVEFAAVELSRSQRAGTPLAVILIDIDHFKQVNDRFGHDAGDSVIRAIGELLQAEVRNTDALARWGGEEFLVVLPATSEQQAANLAERMRVSVANASIPIREMVGAINVTTTVSLGVAAITSPAAFDNGASTGTDDHLHRWSNLLKAADDFLYRAKETGRNRVIASSPIVFENAAGISQNAQP